MLFLATIISFCSIVSGRIFDPRLPSRFGILGVQEMLGYIGGDGDPLFRAFDPVTANVTIATNGSDFNLVDTTTVGP